MKSLSEHPIALFISTEEMSKNSEIASRACMPVRQVRVQISELAKDHPVISISDEKGGIRLPKRFTRCQSVEEIEKEIDAVQRTIDQFQSRKKELNKRLRPLIAYKKAAEKEIKRRTDNES